MLTTKEIIDSFATVNEEGALVDFDFENFNTVVSELYSERAKLRKDLKDLAKEKKDAENAEIGKIGQKYYNSLPKGAEFTYKNSKGEEILATKTEGKSDATAACELVNPPAGAKTAKRYVKFHNIVVPVEFVEALNASEEAVA